MLVLYATYFGLDFCHESIQKDVDFQEVSTMKDNSHSPDNPCGIKQGPFNLC